MVGSGRCHLGSGGTAHLGTWAPAATWWPFPALWLCPTARDFLHYPGWAALLAALLRCPLGAVLRKHMGPWAWPSWSERVGQRSFAGHLPVL